MARYRLSQLARSDIAAILRASERRFGREARMRYRALLTAAMRRVAAEPHGPGTRSQDQIARGLRSYPVRHSRHESSRPPVGEPVHLLFFLVVAPDLVEIARVMHERMDADRQFRN